VSVTAAGGFTAASATAGLKPSGLPDVALVVNVGPRDAAAAVYTSNRCVANPVIWSRQVTGDGTARAVVLNSGGANCYTGPEGFATTHATAELVGSLIGCGAGDVVVCSTGLIGVELPPTPLLSGVRRAAATLSVDGGADAAAAIMTTDTVCKEAAVITAGFTIGGMAKGAAMLAPSLATMLVVLTTDADVDAAICDRALRAAVRVTFDRLDSDGCQSTNDTVLLMASGTSGTAPDAESFTAAVTATCHDLAQQLLADAEGSEHDIAITTTGAATEDDAVEVSRSVARSNLFKTAVFGRDPNWGRILAAAGTTTATFDPLVLDVSINGVLVCRDGHAYAAPSTVDLTGRQVEVVVDLKAGAAQATVWTNDLTHAYVHENSAYST